MPPSRINPTGEPNWCGIRYAATDERLGIHDRPSIRMPRWASRLTLTVSEVRVQRLQDISEEDAIAEGVSNGTRPDGSPFWAPPVGFGGTRFIDSARHAFADLWKTIHGHESWAANPWSAAISFSTTSANIDSLPEQSRSSKSTR